jgi:hypothetical protein
MLAKLDSRKADDSKVMREVLEPKQVAGMILLMLKTIGEGGQPFVPLPESYLHPKHQARLADMFIAITTPEPDEPRPSVPRPGLEGEGW